MRNVIGNHMQELGKKNDRVLVVNADLMGTCRNSSFVEAFPNRSFNVGIAEQNLVAFSAGLAHEGFIPYVFTMAPFMTMRACEQCRTDIAYGNLKVRLMATYAGCSGGISGVTHWGMEDCGIMTSIPNMVVLEPSDPMQAQKMLDASLSFDKPIYLRSSVEPVQAIYNADYQYEIGRASTVLDGEDGAMICSGVVVQYAIDAAKTIALTTGKSMKVIDMHTIKPIDRQAVVEACRTGTVIVAQDHNVFGGLGSQVAKVIAEESLAVNFRILGIPDAFETMAHAKYLYHKFGFDAEGLTQCMLELLGEEP